MVEHRPNSIVDSLVKPEMLINDDLKVVWQHEGHPLSTHAKLHLEVAQEVAKVHVEELSQVRDHDVVRVPVADPQHKGGHAVSRTGQTERLCSFLQTLERITYIVHVINFNIIIKKREYSMCFPNSNMHTCTCTYIGNNY